MTTTAESDARSLLIDLVSISSVSGEEAACVQALTDFFEEKDRPVRIDAMGNIHAPANDAVLLTSHIDTVPGNIPVEVADGYLWGRGSVDAKGSLCAMAVGAVETGVSFVGVVGEEADSRGARHLIESRDEPDTLINGEPSGWDAVTLGYRGLLTGRYVATSRSGHASRPENNAIQDAIGWWNRVVEHFADDEWIPIFEQVTPKPIEIIGGLSDDGLSVEVTLDVQFRIPPAYSPDSVREIADDELEAGTVHWRDAIPPTLQTQRTRPARAFRAAIRELGGDPRQLRKTGTSDMNLYASEWECPMVTYGPGDSSLDHTPDERLSLTEYDKSIDIIERVCHRLTEHDS